MNQFDKDANSELKKIWLEVNKTLKTKQWFRFTLPDHILRTFNRDEYYAAMSWLRRCAWIVRQHIEVQLNHLPPEVKWFQLNEGHS